MEKAGMAIEKLTMEQLANGTKIYLSKLHRFGTDAMLLSHFCNIHHSEKGCDIGTGCGIIPLRWNDNGHKGTAVGIEINPEGKTLLELSIKENDIKNITAITADIREYKTDVLYDVVCCNPPYFNGGFVNKDSEKAKQRHQITCTTEDICKAAARLLKDNGRFCICQRTQYLAQIMAVMLENNITPKRLRFVRQTAGQEPWLMLLDGRKNGGAGLSVLPDLIVGDENGGQSQELLQIYGKI